MKYQRLTFMACIAAVILITAPAIAQTPDGITPPNEGICDALSADGVSKGLYGLCVAFCEAQDWADVSVPITESDLDALSVKAPSGRILASYMKKKTETDPDMPCILVEEPCPCWTADELASIDGVGLAGEPLELLCEVDLVVVDGAAVDTFVTERLALPELGGSFALVRTIVEGAGAGGPLLCIYGFQHPGLPSISRQVTLSPPEFQGCSAQIDVQILASGCQL